MLRADQVGHVGDVIDEGLAPDVVLAEEHADAVDADDAAGLGAGLDLLIDDVAAVAADRLGTGVGKDHRRL
jgi:hypothetical protein